MSEAVCAYLLQMIAQLVVLVSEVARKHVPLRVVRHELARLVVA